MADPQDFITTVINDAITLANEQETRASDAADDLIAISAGFYLTPPSSSTGFLISAIEPDIPSVDNSIITYEAQLAKLVALLSSQLAGFFSTYYPLASDAFDEATSWLVNTITNGGTGINAAIEDAVWQRARERVIADGRRVQDQIAVGFSSKGYSLVPGAMLERTAQSLYEQAGNTGVASTNIAAKQLEIEIETVKFAVGEALKSRFMAMNAAADYIRAIAVSPGTALQVAALNTDNRAKMMSAAGDFYRARLGRDELVLKGKMAELDSTVAVYKHRRDNATQNDQVKVQALGAAADVFARIASAALSSLNSVVSSATNAFS